MISHIELHKQSKTTAKIRDEILALTHHLLMFFFSSLLFVLHCYETVQFLIFIAFQWVNYSIVRVDLDLMSTLVVTSGLIRCRSGTA